jgi:hypothetical protein
MGGDGDEHILVERELLLNVGKQGVDLVCRMRVVYGRGDGHRDRGRADRSEMLVGMNQLLYKVGPTSFPSESRCFGSLFASTMMYIYILASRFEFLIIHTTLVNSLRRCSSIILRSIQH